jgi:hypothetical protein
LRARPERSKSAGCCARGLRIRWSRFDLREVNVRVTGGKLWFHLRNGSGGVIKSSLPFFQSVSLTILKRKKYAYQAVDDL